MRKPYFKWPQVFSIYDSFQPAFHLLSWCLPITFPNSRTSTKRTSLVQILLFTLNISVLIYFYVNVANYGNEFLQMTSDSEIMMTGTKLITFFGIFYIIGINIVFKVLQKRIWTFIKRLDDLDKRIHQFGHVFNYFREFKILLFLCITTFITLIILWIYAILAIGVTNIVVRLTMSYFVLNMNATGMGIILLMPLFIFAIRERFASINWQIRNILHNQEHNQQAAIVTELARCHSQLIDLTDDVNQTLIGFITVDLVASFIFNIMNSLALFRIVYFGDTSGWILRLSNGLWGVFQGGMAAIFLITSDSLTKQCKFTRITIHKALNSLHSAEEDLTERLLMFSQQIKHRLASISCGLFIYDWTLIQSTFSSIVTYLVVIVQFDIEHQRRMNTSRGQ